jgi:hypothetical protein
MLNSPGALIYSHFQSHVSYMCVTEVYRASNAIKTPIQYMWPWEQFAVFDKHRSQCVKQGKKKSDC